MLVPTPIIPNPQERRLIWNGDSALNWLPGGVGGGWRVSEAKESFVASLAGCSVAWPMTPPCLAVPMHRYGELW
jgi:hypothetical protein